MQPARTCIMANTSLGTSAQQAGCDLAADVALLMLGNRHAGYPVLHWPAGVNTLQDAFYRSIVGIALSKGASVHLLHPSVHPVIVHS